MKIFRPRYLLVICPVLVALFLYFFLVTQSHAGAVLTLIALVCTIGAFLLSFLFEFATRSSAALNSQHPWLKFVVFALISFGLAALTSSAPIVTLRQSLLTGNLSPNIPDGELLFVAFLQWYARACLIAVFLVWLYLSVSDPLDIDGTRGRIESVLSRNMHLVYTGVLLLVIAAAIFAVTLHLSIFPNGDARQIAILDDERMYQPTIFHGFFNKRLTNIVRVKWSEEEPAQYFSFGPVGADAYQIDTFVRRYCTVSERYISCSEGSAPRKAFESSRVRLYQSPAAVPEEQWSANEPFWIAAGSHLERVLYFVPSDGTAPKRFIYTEVEPGASDSWRENEARLLNLKSDEEVCARLESAKIERVGRISENSGSTNRMFQVFPCDESFVAKAEAVFSHAPERVVPILDRTILKADMAVAEGYGYFFRETAARDPLRFARLFETRPEDVQRNVLNLLKGELVIHGKPVESKKTVELLRKQLFSLNSTDNGSVSEFAARMEKIYEADAR